MDNKREIKIFLLLILITAFYFRFEALGTPKDFWHDEAFQYLYSEKPVSFILDSNDVHPPLFNLFTKGLLSVGVNEIIELRLIMLIISMLFLWYFFKTIKLIFNENIALISLTTIALSFTYIFYSVEFRNYMFVLLFMILQIREFNRIIRFNQTITLYILFSLIMIYSHYLSGLIIFCQIVYLIILRKELTLNIKEKFVKTYYLLCLFSIPLFIYLVKTLPKIQSFWFKDIDFVSLISTYAYILSPPNDYIYGFSLFYLLIIGTMIYFRKDLDNKVFQFSLYLILPVILMWSISQSFPFYHHRYFIFGGISFFVLLGWSVDKLNKKFGKDLDLFILACWIIFFMAGLTNFYNSFDTDIVDSATFLYDYTNNATDDFFLLHTSTFSQSPMKVYFHDKEHYLFTNLTRQNLFTAGGSVIEDYEIKYNLNFINETNTTIYAMSDRIIGDEIIYQKGGLYVTKIN